MSEVKSNENRVKVHMPETSHKQIKVIFVMMFIFSCLLIVFFVLDRGREEVIQKFEALRDGIVASMPLQLYITKHYADYQTWPQGASVLEAVALTLPESLKEIAVENDGTVVLTYTLVVSDGGQIYLRPMVDQGAKVSWVCLGKQIPEEALPKECSLAPS